MSEKEQFVILVNSEDRKIGKEEKISAHQYGMLHRAFSVLIFRTSQGKKELLLQQRSKNKYHCAGLWTNTCCSHPRPGERSILKAAESRLKEEMGLCIKLKKKGVFHYLAKFENNLYENEIDHVFIGTYDGKEAIHINPEEASDCKWIEVGELQDKLALSPEMFTPWLNKALEIALSDPE